MNSRIKKMALENSRKLGLIDYSIYREELEKIEREELYFQEQKLLTF